MNFTSKSCGRLVIKVVGEASLTRLLRAHFQLNLCSDQLKADCAAGHTFQFLALMPVCNLIVASALILQCHEHLLMLYAIYPVWLPESTVVLSM